MHKENNKVQRTVTIQKYYGALHLISIPHYVYYKYYGALHPNKLLEKTKIPSVCVETNTDRIFHFKPMTFVSLSQDKL
jgi:hypothetical protein